MVRIWPLGVALVASLATMAGCGGASTSVQGAEDGVLASSGWCSSLTSWAITVSGEGDSSVSSSVAGASMMGLPGSGVEKV